MSPQSQTRSRFHEIVLVVLIHTYQSPSLYEQPLRSYKLFLVTAVRHLARILGPPTKSTWRSFRSAKFGWNRRGSFDNMKIVTLRWKFMMHKQNKAVKHKENVAVNYAHRAYTVPVYGLLAPILITDLGIHRVSQLSHRLA